MIYGFTQPNHSIPLTQLHACKRTRTVYQCLQCLEPTLDARKVGVHWYGECANCGTRTEHRVTNDVAWLLGVCDTAKERDLVLKSSVAQTWNAWRFCFAVKCGEYWGFYSNGLRR